MSATIATPLIAFANTALLASGPLATVVAAVKNYAGIHTDSNIQIFNAEDSKPVEIDLRGSIADILASFPSEQPPSPPLTQTLMQQTGFQDALNWALSPGKSPYCPGTGNGCLSRQEELP